MVTWQEKENEKGKEKEKRGIVVQKALVMESLNGVTNDYDQLPVFLAK